MVHLFDTLTGERRALPDGTVRLYVCGVTPYDTTHLGHAFTFIQFDVLVRFLRWIGREVVYVQNVTDVDDSILKRARETGIDWRALGAEGTSRYLADMRSLNVRPPDHFIPATEVVPTIVEMIGRLLEREAAYVADGSIFFRVAAKPEYGELSKLSREAMLAIVATQDDADVDDPSKDDPLDFVLWKGWSGNGDEPWWDSPWGRGRPGWHIECSAINLRCHGPQLTIHGGGEDLAYPHHESEIAQSELVTGVRPFARHWMHVAMTRMSGEKMSKSLGNMVFAADLVRRFGPDAVRLYVLSHHYRQPCDWSATDLRKAARRAEALRSAALPAHGEDAAWDAEREAFRAALADDHDTARALDVLDTLHGRSLRELAAVLGLRLEEGGPVA